MRPPRHLSLSFSLSLSLALGLASPLALAQGAPAAPKAAAPAPAKPAAPQKTAAGAAQAPRKRAPRARKPKPKEAPLDVTGRPVATFPGFRMLPTGGSRVFVQIQGGKVDVAESKAAGRLVYRMKGAGAIQTNRFPLVTSFFATPVAQVQLVDQGNDLDMVIDLRAQTDATYRVVETDQGIVLQVDFPPSIPEQRAPAQAEEKQKRAVRRTISQEPAGSDESSTEF